MVHFNVFLICLHYDQALATEGLVQHGFCVRRGDVQTWGFMLLFKFSAG